MVKAMRHISQRMHRIQLLRVLFFFLLLIILIHFSGCSVKKNEEKKTEPIEYTVMSFSDIPKEFLSEIEKHKEEEFRLCFTSQGFTYIAKGYGKQNTGGYSIRVKEVSFDGEKLFFDCELMGPKKGEAVNKLPSFPYIVVKTEDVSSDVVFR